MSTTSTPEWLPTHFAQLHLLPPSYSSLVLRVHLIGPRGHAIVSVTHTVGLEDTDLVSIVVDPMVRLDDALTTAIGMLEEKLNPMLADLSPF